ncbi:MAG: hypothetical protein L6243_00750 [Candidatus Altiarchaeales archaeon]|nr:Rrf2 family transcriptional regulator [Candidatus Altiarchaeota archaeon]MCG2782098.1 hypothetical protein [Candidatus Altiarchaeales archaeon]MBU4265637.1 Rrf2 family transcriptional regulator [Candidatus Altiarchaeota archaeon]MBU4341054.1 Rrf2 family transcriptional regulator [Candidatus Altiarchaeota archaeon]MBU4406036.1 Rrf2 family transcriptional regulator [Candidatus Altiarchaeota archaeon]
MCTERRKCILTVIVEKHKSLKRKVKIAEIESETGISMAIVRRELDILKGLDLVRSEHGPKGGYSPTIYAARKFMLDF